MRKVCERKHLNQNGDNGQDDDCLWLAMKTTITIMERGFITTILHDKEYGDDNDMKTATMMMMLMMMLMMTLTMISLNCYLFCILPQTHVQIHVQYIYSSTPLLYYL